MDNDTPKMGDNIQADYGQSITDRLELDYGELLATTDETLRDADVAAAILPQTVESSEDVALIAGVVTKMKDIITRAEHHRVAEAAPFLRSKAAIDAFFWRRFRDPLTLVRNELILRLDVYKHRELAKERARRDAELAALRKQQEQANKERAILEAAQRRSRSRKNAEALSEATQRARVEAEIADAKTEQAFLATKEKASAVVGERFEGPERAGKVTMRQTKVIFIENVELLNLELLRPYLKEEHLLTALRQWATATDFKQQMPGAIIKIGDTTVVTK